MDNYVNKINLNCVLDVLKLGMSVTLPNNITISRKNDNYYHDKEGKLDLIPNIENFLEDEFEEFIFWTSEEGNTYEINQMSNKHLTNTIKFLEKNYNEDEIATSSLHSVLTSMKKLLRDRHLNDLLYEGDMGLDIYDF